MRLAYRTHLNGDGEKPTHKKKHQIHQNPEQTLDQRLPPAARTEAGTTSQTPSVTSRMLKHIPVRSLLRRSVPRVSTVWAVHFLVQDRYDWLGVARARSFRRRQVTSPGGGKVGHALHPAFK